MLSASACNSQIDELSQIETAVASTMQVEAEMTATVDARVNLTVTALATALTPPLPSETPTSVPTETLTPTPEVVTVSVSTDTNCRTGPAAAYVYRGSLQVGEISEIVATSTEPNYFYIVNPDRPEEFCWLWGMYATVSGDPARLPVLTPLPRPTAAPAFTLQFYDTFDCGV